MQTLRRLALSLLVVGALVPPARGGEQVGNALTCVGHYTASGVGVATLTVVADWYRVVSQSSTASLATGAATVHLANGAYMSTLASGSVTLEGLYVCVLRKTAGTADQTDVLQGWEVGQGGVENLDAAVTSRSTYAGADTAGVTSLLARVPSLVPVASDLTVGRIGKLDNLDAAVSSRLATSGYTAPSAAPSAASIADAVYDEALSGHTTAGTGGEAWGWIDDIKAKTDTIGAVTVVVSSPVATSGAITLVAGDAYDIDHGRQIDVIVTNGPTLAGATVTLVVDTLLSKAATTILNPGTASQTCRFELTAAQTATLTRIGTAAYSYQVQAAWAADSPSQPATLVSSTVTVVDRYSVP